LRHPGSAQVAPPAVGGAPQGFQPRVQDQIKPLNCPLSVRGLIRIAPTFYGGTRCAYSTPSPAAGIQLPWEPPEPTATPPAQSSKVEGPPPAQSQPKETTPGQPSQPPQRTPL